MLTLVSQQATYDFSVTQGDSLLELIALAAGGMPRDITGWTFSGDVRRLPDDPAPLTAFTFTPATDPTTGQVTFSAASSDTAAWPIDQLVYSCRYVGTNMQTVTFLRGIITVNADPSRS
jgi:hypothetical protein